MSGFVASLSELAILIFQSFRLSVLLPALIFTVANAVFILPSLKDTSVGQVYYAYDQTGQALLLAVLTAFVSYLLSVLNLSIIRWFEGYPLLEWPFRPGTLLQNIHRRHRLGLVYRRDELEEQLDELRDQLREIRVTKKISNPDTMEYQLLESRHQGKATEYQDAVAEYQSVVTELTLFYPASPDRIVPTRLGNVIAAAENYPYVLYGMDAVVLWPLLVPTLTEKGYAKFIEQEKAAFDFLLNTLVLSTILGLEIALSGWLHGADPWVLGLQLFAVVVSALVLYRLSIDGALGWALTIRTSFDLYRDYLRRELRLKRPRDFWEEHSYWEKASRFYGHRHEHFGEDIFDYSEAAFRDRPKGGAPSNSGGTNNTK